MYVKHSNCFISHFFLQHGARTPICWLADGLILISAAVSQRAAASWHARRAALTIDAWIQAFITRAIIPWLGGASGDESEPRSVVADAYVACGVMDTMRVEIVVGENLNCRLLYVSRGKLIGTRCINTS